jgi:hypothetical protein
MAICPVSDVPGIRRAAKNPGERKQGCAILFQYAI